MVTVDPIPAARAIGSSSVMDSAHGRSTMAGMTYSGSWGAATPPGPVEDLDPEQEPEIASAHDSVGHAQEAAAASPSRSCESSDRICAINSQGYTVAVAACTPLRLDEEQPTVGDGNGDADGDDDGDAAAVVVVTA